jgi:hypothetical protein
MPKPERAACSLHRRRGVGADEHLCLALRDVWWAELIVALSVGHRHVDLAGYTVVVVGRRQALAADLQRDMPVEHIVHRHDLLRHVASLGASRRRPQSCTGAKVVRWLDVEGASRHLPVSQSNTTRAAPSPTAIDGSFSEFLIQTEEVTAGEVG